MISLFNLTKKKAQIGSTITWFVAFLIVFFIMLIFIFFSGALATKTSIFGGEEGEIFKTSNTLLVHNELIAILETSVDNKNEKTEKKLKDIILESLNPFIEEKNILGKTSVESLKDAIPGSTINDLWKSEISSPREGNLVYPEKIRKSYTENSKKIVEESRKILDKICNKYYLKIPLGFINEGEFGFYVGSDRDKIFSDIPAFNSEYIKTGFSDIATILIPYRKNIIEIKYRRFLKCQ